MLGWNFEQKEATVIFLGGRDEFSKWVVVVVVVVVWSAYKDIFAMLQLLGIEKKNINAMGGNVFGGKYLYNY